MERFPGLRVFEELLRSEEGNRERVPERQPEHIEQNLYFNPAV